MGTHLCPCCQKRGYTRNSAGEHNDTPQTITLEPAKNWTGHLVCKEEQWVEHAYPDAEIELPPYAILLLEDQ